MKITKNNLAIFLAALLITASLSGCQTNVLYNGETYSQDKYCERFPNINPNRHVLSELQKDNGVLIKYDDGEDYNDLFQPLLKSGFLSYTKTSGYHEHEIDSHTIEKINAACNLNIKNDQRFLQVHQISRKGKTKNSLNGYCESYSTTPKQISKNVALWKYRKSDLNNVRLVSTEVENLKTREVIYRNSIIITDDINILTGQRKSNYCLTDGKVYHE